MGEQARMLVLSHVPPRPPDSGQRRRVFQTLTALRERFHVTLACLEPKQSPEGLCDVFLNVPSLRSTSPSARLTHGLRSAAFRLRTGLRASNYALGQVEFSSERLARLLGDLRFDCVLFEYWHAHAATAFFHERSIPCVLDMHDVLWQSHRERLASTPWMPSGLKRWALARYRRRELAAWQDFDAVIAITPGEHAYLQGELPPGTRTFCTPMGVDTKAFAFDPRPASPPRLAFYGNFSSPPNQRGARRCVKALMPRIWAERPDAELWLVGGQAPPSTRDLAGDPRIHLTGYLKEPAEVLKTLTALLCPWQGTFGFRSRLVEVMALGVPVVVTPDAIHGMGLKEEAGVLLAPDDEGLARRALDLLEDKEAAAHQGRLARRQVEESLSFEATYGRLARDLATWMEHRGNEPTPT